MERTTIKAVETIVHSWVTSGDTRVQTHVNIGSSRVRVYVPSMNHVDGLRRALREAGFGAELSADLVVVLPELTVRRDGTYRLV